MNAGRITTCATSTQFKDWNAIPWQKVEKKVKRIQVRIAKAIREGKYNKAKSLQWLLTHSYYGRLLAVMKVTSNKGKNTPGIDGKTWKTPEEKLEAAGTLKTKGYKPLPLLRKHINKKNGKKRPLGIPTIRDRAMQALLALALKPVGETLADINSYGFREKRACADAIQQIFNSLAKSYSPIWILDADIKACFDMISHEWLLENVTTDKKILRAWLKAGFMENGELFPTHEGTPQGGIISPILANIALDGLERAIKAAVPRRSKVNFTRYADDFVVTGCTKELLEQVVKPVIIAFLAKRGLLLSDEKTRIVHIDDGFDFLGQNVRKYNGKLLIKPTKAAIKSLLDKVRKVVRKMRGAKPETLIWKLNPIIRGWANFHRFVVSKEIFSYIDMRIYWMLRRWAKRRHNKKGIKWLTEKYFSEGDIKGAFSIKVKIQKKQEKGKKKEKSRKKDKPKEKQKYKVYELVKASSTTIKRHIKIRAQANPYDPAFNEYFEKRARNKSVTALDRSEVYNSR